MGPTKPEAFRRLINFASGQPGLICQKPNRLASVQSVRHARSLAEHIGDLAHIENGLFEDVTLATGMDKSNDRYTLACSWNDYNQDGHPNLYVVNHFGKKVLYRSNGNGTFTDVRAETGVEDQGEGMSLT